MSKENRVLVIIPSLRELPLQVQAAANCKYPAQLRIAGAFLFQRIIQSVLSDLRGCLESGDVTRITFALVIPESLQHLRTHLMRSSIKDVFPEFRDLEMANVFFTTLPYADQGLEALSTLPLSVLVNALYQDFPETISETEKVFVHSADVLTRHGKDAPSFFRSVCMAANPKYIQRPCLLLVPTSGNPENWTTFGISALREDGESCIVELLRDRKEMAVPREASTDVLTLGYSGIAYYPPTLPPEGGFVNFVSEDLVGTKFLNSDTHGEGKFTVWAEPLPSAEFFDFGHPIAYLQNKLRFSESRSHNKLEIDIDRGLVTKTSSAAEFSYQCRWFAEATIRGLPLKYLPETSTTVDTTGDHPVFTLETELYSYPSLGDLAISGGMSPFDWYQAGLKVAGLLEDLRNVDYAVNVTVENYGRRCLRMYYNKTRERLLAVLEAIDNGQFKSEGFDTVAAVQTVLDNLSVYVNDLCLPTPVEAEHSRVLVHGDLCFSNILYDRVSRSLKVIDPRGVFGFQPTNRIEQDPTKDTPHLVVNVGHAQFAPFSVGDPAYEVAKLLHSYRYGYEFILDGNYTEPKSAGINYFTSERNIQSMVCFERGLSTVVDARTFARANAICALLFLSMVPLHSNRPDRQSNMLHLGLQLFARNCEALQHADSETH